MVNAEVLKTSNKEDLQLNGFAPEFNEVVIVVGLCSYCLHHFLKVRLLLCQPIFDK